MPQYGSTPKPYVTGHYRARSSSSSSSSSRSSSSSSRSSSSSSRGGGGSSSVVAAAAAGVAVALVLVADLTRVSYIFEESGTTGEHPLKIIRFTHWHT